MNKELKETKRLRKLIKEMNKKNYSITYDYNCDFLQDLETVLNYIDNSIPKEIIENYLKDEKQKFDVYKKESEQNENLKGQMWHHMGAKNMCERILGIEKLVTLD